MYVIDRNSKICTQYISMVNGKVMLILSLQNIHFERKHRDVFRGTKITQKIYGHFSLRILIFG